ncbi:cell cycle checkpoint control protein RAD9B isoform X2 [Oryzias melastigma]|uniref:cell cycle checkpoint control protein RAD9B isoform X2 n=1 Tax=Oryzias melastigma TaxID=30732 RepID=UPI000CF7BD4B|nr:cell cycle checkpoint control protein RAD9B isoform X2 [Oryzias melastigma]
MKCVIEGKNVKVFGRAVQALSRVGDELWLDPTVKGLALRSVSSAQSAYACFIFSPLFFQQYSLGGAPKQSSETVKCKLLLKSLLPLFRCLTSIERNVECCQISVSASSDWVVFQFFCRHGITKTHNLRFQEKEALQAEFASRLCRNVLKAPARLLGDVVMHFPLFQEEITLSTTPLRFSLRNYEDSSESQVKMMYTEMSLHPDEFEHFQVDVDSKITFCLKELKGFLSFTESHCLPVSVHFDSAGKPVCFSVEDLLFEATVVLATLTDPESTDSIQPAGTQVHATSRCVDVAALHVKTHRADEESASVNASPASSVICALLFKAVSSEQDDGVCAATPPVLAGDTDDEEMMEELCPRSPSP